MKQPFPPTQIEPRWPVALTILVVLFLLTVLPDRIRLLPAWFVYVATFLSLASMLLVSLTATTARWRRVERMIILFFILVVGGSTLTGLASLIREMLRHSEDLGGLELLSSSVGIWVSNVLVFSLLYWQSDRGGPETRMNNTGIRPDWLFPQTGVPEEAPPNWRPTFVDYLFLAFSTATAFSPTDTLPLTSRAKLLMMLESSISLMTIVVVGARAINILGS